MNHYNARYQISAYADDVMVFVNRQQDVNILKTVCKDFGVISAAKINWEKSDALAIGHWDQGLPILPGGLTWKRGGIKYLGIYLGDANMQKKNWEGLIEKVEGRLAKWKWIHSQLSFRGRVLIINNLVASTLWHKLSCVEPPIGLLPRLQAIFVNFFWNKLHWVPQSVLFLPKEEGGQGLIHLPSRLATFRLQFIQRFLTGPASLVWRSIARIILQRADYIGLDSALFLVDSKRLRLNGLPSFYQGLFKCWGHFIIVRPEPLDSLFWLLEEPLIGGARLDITEDVLGLKKMLCDTKTFKLMHLVKVAGHGLNNVTAMAALLSQRSIRHTETILDLWRRKLTQEEHTLLSEYGNGHIVPDDKDPFPLLWMTPELKGMSGVLLDFNDVHSSILEDVEGKVLYKYFVKLLNKTSLNGRVDTVWRGKFSLADEVKPVWRVLYKPPLKKRSADLQWRVLHGAVAVNAFVSVINSNVVDKCVFCGLRETVFHCFMECTRLNSLFQVLNQLFLDFGEKFTLAAFILGAGYNQKHKVKWQLINFLVGEAKLAIYIKEKQNGKSTWSGFNCSF